MKFYQVTKVKQNFPIKICQECLDKCRNDVTEEGRYVYTFWIELLARENKVCSICKRNGEL